MSAEANNNNIKVAVRVRPFNQREKDLLATSNASSAQSSTSTPTLVVAAKFYPTKKQIICNEKIFNVDFALWSVDDRPDAEGNSKCITQSDCFEIVAKPILHHSFAGYNSCLFCYGMTGSGKTHSMMCAKKNSAGNEQRDVEERGIIPRLASELFLIQNNNNQNENENDDDVLGGDQNNNNTKSTWSFKIGYIEVYNEKVSDLLSISNQNNKSNNNNNNNSKKKSNISHNDSSDGNSNNNNNNYLRVREHPTKGVYLENQNVVTVHNFDQVLALIELGNKNRTSAATLMNEASSRSHAIFQVFLEETRTMRLQEQEIRTAGKSSRINLVDLAGSERVSQSGVSGKQFEQMKYINLSLTTLGRVIDVLAENAQQQQPKNCSGTTTTTTTTASTKIPPYRDSTLTYLLRDSLGGNSKTVMIATISPAVSSLSETLSTLEYASRARQIVNVATVNEDPKAKRIRELEEQLALVMARLENFTDKNINQEQQQQQDVPPQSLHCGSASSSSDSTGNIPNKEEDNRHRYSNSKIDVVAEVAAASVEAATTISELQKRIEELVDQNHKLKTTTSHSDGNRKSFFHNNNENSFMRKTGLFGAASALIASSQSALHFPRVKQEKIIIDVDDDGDHHHQNKKKKKTRNIFDDDYEEEEEENGDVDNDENQNRGKENDEQYEQESDDDSSDNIIMSQATNVPYSTNYFDISSADQQKRQQKQVDVVLEFHPSQHGMKPQRRQRQVSPSTKSNRENLPEEESQQQTQQSKKPRGKRSGVAKQKIVHNEDDVEEVDHGDDEIISTQKTTTRGKSKNNKNAEKIPKIPSPSLVLARASNEDDASQQNIYGNNSNNNMNDDDDDGNYLLISLSQKPGNNQSIREQKRGRGRKNNKSGKDANREHEDDDDDLVLVKANKDSQSLPSFSQQQQQQQQNNENSSNFQKSNNSDSNNNIVDDGAERQLPKENLIILRHERNVFKLKSEILEKQLLRERAEKTKTDEKNQELEKKLQDLQQKLDSLSFQKANNVNAISPVPSQPVTKIQENNNNSNNNIVSSSRSQKSTSLQNQSLLLSFPPQQQQSSLLMSSPPPSLSKSRSPVPSNNNNINMSSMSQQQQQFSFLAPATLPLFLSGESPANNNNNNNCFFVPSSSTSTLLSSVMKNIASVNQMNASNNNMNQQQQMLTTSGSIGSPKPAVVEQQQQQQQQQFQPRRSLRNSYSAPAVLLGNENFQS